MAAIQVRSRSKRRAIGASLSFLLLASCGTHVPEKDIARDDQAAPNGSRPVSARGAYESEIIDHIQCEVALGLVLSDQRFGLPWLRKWGTSITITTTAQEQGGLNPNASFGAPLRNAIHAFGNGNVTSSQSYAVGLGLGTSASTTRSETIQFTYRIADLLKRFNLNTNCDSYRKGIQIDGDLKIRQFVFDKMAIARNGNANLAEPPPGGRWALFNALTEELIFNTAYTSSLNPTLKLANTNLDSTGNLLAAARSYTNDLIITFGPLKGTPGPDTPVELGQSAQNQHNAKVSASAISTAINAGR